MWNGNFILTVPYLREVQHKLKYITGAYYDCSIICCAIKRLGTTRHVAIQRCDVQRARYISEIMNFNH